MLGLLNKMYRAVCKLCRTTIKAEFKQYVSCACGEISLNYLEPEIKFIAREWENFIHLDDEGNEILINVIEKEDISSAKPHPEGISKPSIEELLGLLNHMIKTYEELPPNAMTTPITHYDLLSVLLLFAELFRASCKEES